jgi:predicted dienelactone hydrolase
MRSRKMIATIGTVHLPDREPVRPFAQNRWLASERCVTTGPSSCQPLKKTPMPALSLSVLPAVAALTILSASVAPDAVSAQIAPAAVAPAAVSFTRIVVPDGDDPPIEAGIWAPRDTSPSARSLVVISHGTGGDFHSHHDTAAALAQAGFVVAALTHTGDNWRDRSRATDMAERPRQLSALIDYMLSKWEGRCGIDAKRVGAFGFSSGGFTVLAAAGGIPDLSRIAGHCRANPAFYDCTLTAAHLPGSRASQRWTHDMRIKAVVAAAPALGFTFTRAGLAGVGQPVQLWQAEKDRVLPSPWYAEPVRAALSRAPEFHNVTGADHFDFLPPCAPPRRGLTARRFTSVSIAR